MPKLSSLAVKLSPRWQPGPEMPKARGRPEMPMPSSPHPAGNPMMLGSLPVIATNANQGISKQFYGGRTLPRRQLILPG